MRDRCVILSRSRRRALAGGLTAVLLMLTAPVLAENPPAAALQPSHSAEADQAKQYADCMSAARATPAQGLTTAQLWAQKGGGTPAGHCAAVALIGLGRYEEAASSMEKLAGQEMKGRKDLAASLYDQAAQAWVLANDNAKAVKDVGAAIALAPQDPDLLVDRGVILASMGRYRESVDDLSKAHDLAGSRADILVFRATAYRMLKSFDLARADIDQAIKLEPKNPDAYLERGIIRKLRNDTPGAREDWQRAVALGPGTLAAQTAEANLKQLDQGGAPVATQPAPPPGPTAAPTQ
ncbi:MAG TPA: tetratricopeptide repeat protein [Dongiaceae bacterium]|nr:tetratricopeptide repeat protein [Dongiaceae bacterium]